MNRKVFSLLQVIAIGLLEIHQLCAQPYVAQMCTYGRFRGAAIHDVYQCEDGGYVMVGKMPRDTMRVTISQCWILKVNPDGELQWENTWDMFADNLSEYPKSVIETDNGDFMVGAGIRAFQGFIATRSSGEDGEMLWERMYSEGSFDICNAIIETKAGSLLLAGSKEVGDGPVGYAISVDEDGEINWEMEYDPDVCTQIHAIREVPDQGFYFAGICNRSSALLHVNGTGEVIDNWRYPMGGASSNYFTLVSSGESFVSAGTYQRNQVGNPRVSSLSRDGRFLWDQQLEIDGWCQTEGLAKFRDGKLAIVGMTDGSPLVVWMDRSGNPFWITNLRTLQEFNIIGELYGCIVNRNQELVAVGQQFSPNVPTGLFLRFGFERLEPEIVFVTPTPGEFDVLQNDDLRFLVRAEDRQDDTIYYHYFIDSELFSEDSSIVLNWGDLGDHSVVCEVSDGAFSDSVTWHVTVTDLYVQSFTPDTLSLAIRRGQSVDFSLDTVRAVEGDPVEYVWLKRNVDIVDEVDTVGLESDATVSFLQSGHYRVDGVAYRGESSDVVSWDVSVRGAIWAFAPEDLAFEVLPDSVVSFIVEPTFPDAEGQRVQWLIDGELAAEDTTNFEWQFGDRFGNLSHGVQVVVADTVEADTVTWIVTVVEPDFVSDRRDAYPTRAELLSVSPNPFNSTLTIRYQSVKSVQSVVNIFDLSGRLVADFSKTTPPYSPPSIEGGVNALIWDASSIPAGVYFVRLQSGRVVATKKVVLMR